jgi:class 3 adenylate cyclase
VLLPREGNVFDGRYVIVETIGKGGMATIYRAVDRQDQSRCALKVLNTCLNSDEPSIRQFFNEARMAGRLQHPNIVRILDYGRTRVGYLYIAMELLEGQTLARLVRGNGPFGVERSIAVMAQVLDALQEAHARGTVHRDLKPENICLLDRDGLEQVKLLDFGIAHLAGSVMHSTSDIVGTPHYMSPEQIRSRVALPESDLYSAGVVLYEMLTGTRPFSGSTTLEVLKNQIRAPIPTLEAVVPELASYPKLNDLVRKLMAKTPVQRFPTAGSVKESLVAACKEHGIPLPGVWSGAVHLSVDVEKAEATPRDMRAVRKAMKAHHQLLSETLDDFSILDLTGGDGGRRHVARPVKIADAAREVVLTLLHVRLVRGVEHDTQPVREWLDQHLPPWFECISERRGVVCHDAGDELKVLFGYLDAGEEQADRAVDCARELIQLIQRSLTKSHQSCPVRCGIATGKVYLDTDEDGPPDWMIRGSRIELAERLSRLCPEHAMVLCEETALRLSRLPAEQPLTSVATRWGDKVHTWLIRPDAGDGRGAGIPDVVSLPVAWDAMDGNELSRPGALL